MMPSRLCLRRADFAPGPGVNVNATQDNVTAFGVKIDTLVTCLPDTQGCNIAHTTPGMVV
jgi:hypothetical protein